MDLLSVVKAPCAPFSIRPRGRLGRSQRRGSIVHCAAQQKPRDDRLDSLAEKLGKACAPFAAAMLLLAQANPAVAETQFQASLRRQSEFFSKGKSGSADTLFKKGIEGAKDSAKDTVESAKGAASSGPDLPISKPDAGGALDSIKSAASDAASTAQSAAKGAAPDDVSKGGKDAASSIVEGAKGIVSLSQKEAEVAGTGTETPSGGGLTSQATDAAKSAAGGVKDAADKAGSRPVDTALNTVKSVAGDAQDSAKSATGGNPVDAAKSAAKEAKGSAESATGGSNPVDSAIGTAKSVTADVRASNEKGAGGDSLDGAADAAKSAAGKAADSAGDVPKPNFLQGLFGLGGNKESSETKAAKESYGGEGGPGGGSSAVAPQPSQLEEKVPAGAEPLPEQPYPEPESKQLGDDNAGGTVQDTARGSGPLDLFGGGNSGKSPEAKANDLVKQAENPNPNSSFLGGLFGIEESKQETPKAPDFGLSGSSSLPTKNELGEAAELEAPQPSSLEEAGNLPESAPGSEIKLPEQPKPEESSPAELGKDSSGGATGSTKSGSGGPLDFFGGSSSNQQQPNSSNPIAFDSSNTASNPISLVAEGERLAPPQPSDVSEAGILPKTAPGSENKLPEQPKPEESSPAQLGKDSAGGQTGSTKSGSGGLLDFFGGSSSNPQQPGNSSTVAFNPSDKASNPISLLAEGERLAPPQPSDVSEAGILPKTAPGSENKLPEQPKPEESSPAELGKDSAGGQTGSTKSGSGGPLDFFGGSSSNPQQPGNSTPVATTPGNNPSNPISLLAAEQLEAPQPSALEEDGNLPESSPGTEIKLPEQPFPEPSAPEDLGKDSAGGETGSTKSGSNGPLDFFGGSQSALPNSDAKQLPVSLTYNNSNLLTFVADQLEAPQPSDFDEKLPEGSPGTPLEPDEQPYPEPASKQLPQDTAGGETQDTKRGSGALDFFGGSGSGDSGKAAAENIEKAKSLTTSVTPDSAKVSFEIPNKASNAVAEVAEAEAIEAPEDTGKVTAIGAGLSLALAILIFTIQPQAESKHH